MNVDDRFEGAVSGRILTPEEFMEQGYNVPLPVAVQKEDKAKKKSSRKKKEEVVKDITIDTGDGHEHEEGLEFLGPLDMALPEKEAANRPRKKKKKSSKAAGEKVEDATEEPKGDWSEFASARVDETAGDDEDSGHSGKVNTYTVIEKAEYDKIEVSPSEARGTIPYDALRNMCMQMSRILDSGVSIIHAVRIVADQTKNDVLEEVLEAVYEDIRKGEDIAVAMSNRGCFPLAFTVALSAADKSGCVAETFRDYAVIFEREEECRDMGRLQLFYPALVTACSLFVMVIMMLVVYPGFVNMFSGMDTELPGLSKALLSLAETFRGVWWIITLFIVCALLAIFLYRKASSANLLGHKMGERAVPEGTYKRMNVYAKFARHMNALLKAGVSTKDALFVTAHSFTEYPFLTENLIDAANAAAQGSTLSNALCVFDFFPIMVLQMISVGEEMGDTPTMLMYVAQYYEEESGKDAARRMGRKEPISIIFMAVVVIFLLLSMLQPILRFYELVNGL